MCTTASNLNPSLFERNVCTCSDSGRILDAPLFALLPDTGYATKSSTSTNHHRFYLWCEHVCHIWDQLCRYSVRRSEESKEWSGESRLKLCQHSPSLLFCFMCCKICPWTAERMFISFIIVFTIIFIPAFCAFTNISK